MRSSKTDDSRAAAREAFLASSGMAHQAPRALAADASARRYFRLEGEGRLLLQDASDAPSLAQFIAVATHLRALGLSAPEVPHHDIDAGFALIEDFGEGTYTRLLVRGAEEEALYALATDTLRFLHDQPEATRIDAPRFDLERMLDELTLFTDWFVPHVTGKPVKETFRREFLSLARHALAPVGPCEDALILRDFHVDNLMLLEGRSGVAACGLLDFQDAVIGGAAYDLVSLLQDARRDLGEGLERRMLDRYLAARAGIDPEAFLRQYHLYGMQRHLRIAGVFVRLAERDGKPHYLDFMPRVLGQARAALEASNQGEILTLLSKSLGQWDIWRREG